MGANGKQQPGKGSARELPPSNPVQPIKKRRLLFRAIDLFRRVTVNDIRKGAAVTVILFGVMHCATTYGVNTTICVGPSMMPTIPPDPRGTMVLIDAFSHKVMRKPFLVGDVVITGTPGKPTRWVCKRVAATAGDSVVVMSKNMNHRVNRYGRQPDPVVVPPGHVWLAGDNWDNSSDSRSYGPVPVNLIKGRAWIKAVPVDPEDTSFFRMVRPVFFERAPFRNDSIIVRRKRTAVEEAVAAIDMHLTLVQGKGKGKGQSEGGDSGDGQGLTMGQTAERGGAGDETGNLQHPQLLPLPLPPPPPHQDLVYAKPQHQPQQSVEQPQAPAHQEQREDV